MQTHTACVILPATVMRRPIRKSLMRHLFLMHYKGDGTTQKSSMHQSPSAEIHTNFCILPFEVFHRRMVCICFCLVISKYNNMDVIACVNSFDVYGNFWRGFSQRCCHNNSIHNEVKAYFYKNYRICCHLKPLLVGGFVILFTPAIRLKTKF